MAQHLTDLQAERRGHRADRRGHQELVPQRWAHVACQSGGDPSGNKVARKDCRGLSGSRVGCAIGDRAGQQRGGDAGVAHDPVFQLEEAVHACAKHDSAGQGGLGDAGCFDPILHRQQREAASAQWFEQGKRGFDLKRLGCQDGMIRRRCGIACCGHRHTHLPLGPAFGQQHARVSQGLEPRSSGDQQNFMPGVVQPRAQETADCPGADDDKPAHRIRRRSGCPGAAGLDGRAAFRLRIRCGTGRAPAVRAQPCRQSLPGLPAGKGTWW